MDDRLPLFRPPSEARSLIIRVADGCPHNSCTFCGMYKAVRYRPHTEHELHDELAAAAKAWPDAQRIFLADGDVLALPESILVGILEALNARLGRLSRISLYANGSSILTQGAPALRRMRALKLQTLYMGLESGDQETLSRVGKRDTVAVMIDAARLAAACDLRLSVMVLLGLAGRDRSRRHAVATAEALNQMQPPLLAALRYIPIRGTGLGEAVAAGGFDLLTEVEAAMELRQLVAGMELAGTVFRANHASNVMPLGGRLPRDKARLLNELDGLIASGMLDECSPGRMPFTL